MKQTISSIRYIYFSKIIYIPIYLFSIKIKLKFSFLKIFDSYQFYKNQSGPKFSIYFFKS